MKTNETNTTVAPAKSKMNVFLKAGVILAFVSLIVPAILTTIVLPSAPQYAQQIFAASIGMSYVTAVAAGTIAFGALLRFIGK